MLLKTVSKYTVSLANSRFPVLGENSKSLRHELQNTNKPKQTKKYNMRFIKRNSLEVKNITFHIMI